MMETQELMSALADGQLQGEDRSRGLDAAVSDPAARAAWQSYHVIGDVLRSADLAPRAGQDAFLAKLQARLAQETIAPVVAPRVLPVVADAALAVARPEGQAANDGGLRWKLAAGFASVAAVAAIGWNLLGAAAPAPAGMAGAQLASTVQPTVNAAVVAGTSEARPGAMLRDPNLDRFLAAHRQSGGATALQAPAGFLRNATFEGPAR